MRKISELIKLDNRKAVVTGGAGYIGLAICETLLELGATVSVLDMDGSACEERCELLNKIGYGSKALPLPADLSDENQTEL